MDNIRKLYTWYKNQPSTIKKVLAGIVIAIPCLIFFTIMIMSIMGGRYIEPIDWKDDKKDTVTGRKNQKDTDVIPKKESDEISAKLDEIEKTLD